MKRKILGIGSVVLASIALFFLIKTPYYPSIGSLILKKIGPSTWTEGDKGFHLAILCSAIFVCIAFIGMSKCLYKEYPKTRNKGKWLVLGLTIILVIVSNQTIKVNKSLQPGLRAIHFMSDKSGFGYRYEGEKVVKAGGALIFKNYSNTSRSFYIKCIPDDKITNQSSVKELIGYDSKGETPELIQIEPKSIARVQIDFDASQLLSNENKGTQGYGNQRIQTLIIYNDEEQVEFIDGDFMGVIK